MRRRVWCNPSLNVEVTTSIRGVMQSKMQITLKLWNILQDRIVSEECTSIFNLETQLTPVLLDMKTKGVRVDLDKAEKTKKELVSLERVT